MFDLIIKNGKIADGTGNDCYISDIGIKDGVISKIGILNDGTADKIIDANGNLVTPGFIDMHSHGDLTLLIYPKMESQVLQGITTIVGGQCGYSLAPIDGYWVYSYFETEVINEVEPFIYAPGEMHQLEKIKDKLKEKFGLDVNWKIFGDFLDKVEETGISANYVPLVGHGQIKAQVMGEDHKRPATDEEIKKMQKYLEEALESGAYGMSVGLGYVPGKYSAFDELLEVSRVLKKYNGIYFAHYRKSGLRGSLKKQKKIDGIIETLEIGRQLDIQVQISHIAPGFDIFPGKNTYMVKAAAEATLQVIDSYVKEGVKAAFDVIPNITAGLEIVPSLASLFYPWIKQSGSVEQFIKNLKAKDYKVWMIDLINSGQFYMINLLRTPDWDDFIIVLDSINKDYLGKSVKEIADLKGKSSMEILFDLLIEDPEIKIRSSFVELTMESIKQFLNHPLATVGTDTCSLDINSMWTGDINQNGWLPSPNTYCGMVKYVKELGMDRIEDTIRKATGKPAEILGLKDRGVIKEGFIADILVIDMDNLKTNENLIEPRAFPEGIEYVLVNGKVAVNKGIHTGIMAGKVLRKTNSELWT